MKDRFDEQLFSMAEQEKIVVPDSLEDTINRTLERSEEKNGTVVTIDRTGKADRNGSNGRIYGMPKRKRWSAALVAICVVLAGGTAIASVGSYRERMEALNREKLEEYYTQIYSSVIQHDNYNRDFTDTETDRLEILRASYREQGLFPDKELTLLENAEEYSKGVGYLPYSGTFFFPDREMKDEELLEYIDFTEKRDYSLAKLNEEAAQPELFVEIPKPAEPEITDMSEIDVDAVYEPGQALNLQYEGDMSVQCITAGNNRVYLGGYNRIEYTAIGSGASELFFEGFGEGDVLVGSLFEGEDGTLYAGVSRLTAQDTYMGQLEIYQIDSTGQLLQRITVDHAERNWIDDMAVDAEGNIYILTRKPVEADDARILIYDKEGEPLSRVNNSAGYTIHISAGIGVSSDGKVYAAVQNADTGSNGLAQLDPIAGEMTVLYTDLMPEGYNLPWDAVGSGKNTDLIMWGYEGIYTYHEGDEKAIQVVAPYEAPCTFEGACATILSDGRVVLLNSTEGVDITLQNGNVRQWVKSPEKTTISYIPTTP